MEGSSKKRRRLWYLALASSLWACAGPPPVFHESMRGDIRAFDNASAKQTARWLDELQPVIEEWIPGSRAGQRFEVWRMTEAAWPGPGVPSDHDASYGVHTEGAAQIRLRDQPTIPGMEGVSAAPEWALRTKAILAHELVHGLLGDSWDALPRVVEEGLCDFLAARAVPELAGAERTTQALPLLLLATTEPVHVFATASADHCVGTATATLLRPTPLPDPETFLSVGASGVPPPWHRDADRVGRALGFALVSRIMERGGIEDLHRIAAISREPTSRAALTDALLDAAALDNLEANTLISLARGLLDRDDSNRWLGLVFAELVEGAETELRQQLAGQATTSSRLTTKRIEIRVGAKTSFGRFRLQ